MATTEIKIGGLGGQGVILNALIVGKAAAIFDNKNATMTQAFGPEARGSACSAQLVVDDDPVLYPYVHKPQVMVCMSQDAFNKFAPDLRSDGILIIEEDLVKVKDLPPTVKVFAIPATRFAEELGKKMVLNIVMVGAFTAITKAISPEAARKAVADSVPPPTIELNTRAFEKGFAYGSELKAKMA